MQEDPAPPNINSWLEDELFSQYRQDRRAVDSSWTPIFEAAAPPVNGGNGHRPASATPAATMDPPPMKALTAPVVAKNPDSPAVPVSADDDVQPLKGPA